MRHAASLRQVGAAFANAELTEQATLEEVVQVTGMSIFHLSRRS